MLPGAAALELRFACASFRFSQGFVFVTHVCAEPKSGTEHSTRDAAPLEDCVRVQLTTMLLGQVPEDHDKSMSRHWDVRSRLSLLGLKRVTGLLQHMAFPWRLK